MVTKKGENPRHRNVKKHKFSSQDVNGIPVTTLAKNIKFRGMVNLHITKEQSESYLTEYEWPKGSGDYWYACCATGLLFDKQTGVCRQSTFVSLDIATVEKSHLSESAFKKMIDDRAREEAAKNPLKAKPGPKKKGSSQDDEGVDDYDSSDE